MTTMQDVADKAGVSLSTVSYALSGSRPISEQTRKRVQRAMRDLGYAPNEMARALKSRRSRMLALLMADPARLPGGSALDFLLPAAEAAQERGYRLLLWPSEPKSAAEYRELSRSGLIEGALVMEVGMRDPRIPLLEQAGIPFAMIGRTADPAKHAYVDIDFEATMRETVDRLFLLGHRDIAMLNYPEQKRRTGYGPAVRGLAGFDAAMRSHALVPISRNCSDRPGAIGALVSEVLETTPRPSAFICMHEGIVPTVLRTIEVRGLKIPEDVTVIAIASSKGISEALHPTVSTLRLEAPELGRIGVNALIDRLEYPDAQLVQRLLKATLVERASSGPGPLAASTRTSHEGTTRRRKA